MSAAHAVQGKRSLGVRSSLVALLLCTGLQEPSLGQETLREQVEALRMSAQGGSKAWLDRIAVLRAKATALSNEHAELLNMVAIQSVREMNHRALLALEPEWELWLKSSKESERLMGDLLQAIAWGLYYIQAGLPQVAEDELARVDPVRTETLPSRWRVRLLEVQAQIARVARNSARSLEIRRAQVAIARSDSPEKLALTLAVLGTELRQAGLLDEAFAVLRESIAVLSAGHAHKPLLLADANIRLANALANHQPTEAHQHAKAAKALVNRSEDSQTTRRARSGLASLLVRLGDYEGALALAVLARDSRQPHLDFHSRFYGGLAKVGLGQVEVGKIEALMALGSWQARDGLGSATDAWRELSDVLQTKGDLLGAYETAQMARELEQQSRNAREVTHTRSLAPQTPVQGGTWDSRSNKRIALVIGNKDYLLAPLRNPLHDAQALAKSLERAGFKVQRIENLRRDDIGAAMDQFLGAVRPGDDVVFFYAGHGLQVRGINYLPAVDARIRSESDVALNSIDLNALAERLKDLGAGTRLLLIDACRDNPYGDKARLSTRGLGRMPGLPAGTLAQFAARPGAVAEDGAGEHGLFTEQLLHALRGPPLPVELLLKRVSVAVRKHSGGSQEPWIEGSLDRDLQLAIGTRADTAPLGR